MADALEKIRFNTREVPRLRNVPIEIERADQYFDDPYKAESFKAISEWAKKADSVMLTNKKLETENEIQKLKNDFMAENMTDPTIYGDKARMSEVMKKYDDMITASKKVIQGNQYLNDAEITSYMGMLEKDAGVFTANQIKKSNEYQIQSAVDTTMLNIESSIIEANNLDPNSEDADTKLNKIGDNLITYRNNLVELGYTPGKADGLLLRSQSQIMGAIADKKIYNDIVSNMELNPKQKLDMLEQYKQTMTNQNYLDGLVQGVVDRYTGEDKEAFKNMAKTIIEGSIRDKFDTSKKVESQNYVRYLEQIRNENYALQIQIMRERERLQDEYDRGRISVETNIRSGNDLLAINKAEGQAYTLQDITDNPMLMKRYYGKTAYEIGRDDEYVNLLTRPEVNTLIAKKQRDRERGLTDDVILDEQIEYLNTFDDDSRKIVANQLIDAGVVDEADYTLYTNGGYTRQEVKEVSMYKGIGQRNKRANKLDFASFVGKDKYVTEIRNKTKDLTPAQREFVSDYMFGKVIGTDLNKEVLTQNGFNATAVKMAYQKSPRFASEFNYAVELSKNIEPKTYKQVRVNTRTIQKTFEDKFDSGTIRVRRKSLESAAGTSPVIQTIKVGAEKKKVKNPVEALENAFE